MTDAAAFLLAVAAGIVANLISFAALQNFHQPPSTVIRVGRRSLTIERVRVRGPLNYEVDKAIIRETTFVVENRNLTKLHIAISLAPAVAVFATLLWLLAYK